MTMNHLDVANNEPLFIYIHNILLLQNVSEGYAQLGMAPKHIISWIPSLDSKIPEMQASYV